MGFNRATPVKLLTSAELKKFNKVASKEFEEKFENMLTNMFWTKTETDKYKFIYQSEISEYEKRLDIWIEENRVLLQDPGLQKYMPFLEGYTTPFLEGHTTGIDGIGIGPGPSMALFMAGMLNGSEVRGKYREAACVIMRNWRSALSKAPYKGSSESEIMSSSDNELESFIKLADSPLEDVPLYMQETGICGDFVKWRLENSV